MISDFALRCEVARLCRQHQAVLALVVAVKSVLAAAPLSGIAAAVFADQTDSETAA
jgi:hypothetical protein